MTTATTEAIALTTEEHEALIAHAHPSDCGDCSHVVGDAPDGCFCAFCICPHVEGGLYDSDGKCCGSCHDGPCEWQS